jgi:hypothetical protein
MHGGLSEIGIPKGVGLVRGKGQRGDDRTELREPTRRANQRWTRYKGFEL